MLLVAAISLPAKVLDEVAGLRQELEPLASGQWLGPENLCVRLATLGQVPEGSGDLVVAAADRAAATQQSFEVIFSGLGFHETRQGVEAYLRATDNAGMLQSLTFSLLERLPEDVSPEIELPWRPFLTLGSFGSLSSDVRLRMEAAVHGRSWTLKVRSCGLFKVAVDGGLEELHLAKLPAAAA